MNYNQISELLYDSIWAFSEKTSKQKLILFYNELDRATGGNTSEYMKSFEGEKESVYRFAKSIFNAKEFGRFPSLRSMSRELKKIRLDL